VIGKKGMQVDWRVDGAVLEAAMMTHRNITVAYMECANHVLKYEPRDTAQLTTVEATTAYNADGTVLDAESVETITTRFNTHC
jgi:uncharacterized protein